MRQLFWSFRPSPLRGFCINDSGQKGFVDYLLFFKTVRTNRLDLLKIQPHCRPQMCLLEPRQSRPYRPMLGELASRAKFNQDVSFCALSNVFALFFAKNHIQINALLSRYLALAFFCVSNLQTSACFTCPPKINISTPPKQKPSSH